MKVFESKINFYNKYWYKLEIDNTLAHIFREKNFLYAKTCLEVIQHDFDKGKELFLSRKYIKSPVRNSDFLDSKLLLKEFKSYNKDFKLRVQNPCLTVYSNDFEWLEFLGRSVNSNPRLYKPTDQVKALLENDVKVVVVKKPTKFNLKVTLKSRVNEDFINWVTHNRDKIKIGERALKSIQHGWSAKGYYFYCTTNVLNLITIMIGENIGKVEQVVVDTSIDK